MQEFYIKKISMSVIVNEILVVYNCLLKPKLVEYTVKKVTLH